MHDAFELMFSEKEYEFLGVCDGDRALEVLRGRPADVVLLDLRMPGIEGLELLQRIKALRPATSVIVVSVVDQVRPALESLRLGAMDYLTKPFEEDRLQLLVRQAIAQTSIGGRSSPLPTPAKALIIGKNLGVRATLAAALGRCCTVRVVRTVVEAASAFAKSAPDIIIADVVAARSASEDVFVRLQARFSGVPLIWIASPSQWVPYSQDRCAVLRIPLDYGQLLGEAASLFPSESAPSLRNPGLISGRVLTYLSEHFADTSVEDIAQTVRLSPGHLSRVFRDEMGLGPKDFLTQVRLEAARCLLRETGEKVGAIATMAGFYDAPHLARLFRNYDGCTPRKYRLSDRPD